MQTKPSFTLLLAALLAGCQSPRNIQSRITSPNIAPDPKIRTMGDYENACDQAQENLQANPLPSIPGQIPAVAVIQALAKLPSKESRTYARALANALAPCNVKGLDNLNTQGGKSAMTYPELAEVQALTLQLFTNPNDETISSPVQLPGNALLDLELAIAQYCPSDQALLFIVGAAGPPKSFASPYETFDNQTSQKLNALGQALLYRWTDRARHPNLSWQGLWCSDPEAAQNFFLLLENPTGHDLQSILAAMVEETPELDKLGPTPEEKDTLTRVAALLQSDDGKKELASIDEHLLNIKKAGPAIRQFIQAVSDNNLSAAADLLTSPEDLLDIADKLRPAHTRKIETLRIAPYIEFSDNDIARVTLRTIRDDQTIQITQAEIKLEKSPTGWQIKSLSPRS